MYLEELKTCLQKERSIAMCFYSTVLLCKEQFSVDSQELLDKDISQVLRSNKLQFSFICRHEHVNNRSNVQRGKRVKVIF